jgi:hypothetical protein
MAAKLPKVRVERVAVAFSESSKGSEYDLDLKNKGNNLRLWIE